MSALKPTPEKYCEYCNKQLTRKRYPGGALESLANFNRRRFCDTSCSGQHSKQPYATKRVMRSKLNAAASTLERIIEMNEDAKHPQTDIAKLAAETLIYINKKELPDG